MPFWWMCVSLWLCVATCACSFLNLPRPAAGVRSFRLFVEPANRRQYIYTADSKGSTDWRPVGVIAAESSVTPSLTDTATNLFLRITLSFFLPPVSVRWMEKNSVKWQIEGFDFFCFLCTERSATFNATPHAALWRALLFPDVHKLHLSKCKREVFHDR